MTPNLSIVLNLSRWVAAWLVLLSHARHLVLVDLGGVQQATLLDKGLYFFTGLGHESVVIFFVISGFLVGGTTLHRWQQHGPNLRSYAIARFSRIYTVLIPALLAGLVLDMVGLRWFNASALYTDSIRYHTISLGSNTSAALDAHTFLGNVLMLQGIWTESFGSNNPLWSLAYEWWYYCIFALFAAAWTGTGRWRALAAVAGAAILVGLPMPFLLWGTIWLLGLITYGWTMSRLWRPHPLLGALLLAIAVVWSRTSHNVNNLDHPESLLTGFTRDLLLGMAYAVALTSVTRMKSTVAFSRFHARMADVSYSTYLCHFPAMLLIVAVVYQELGTPFQLQPDMRGIAYLGCLVGVLLVYCAAFAWLTERHTAAVQRRIKTALTRTP
jgi:peptidoglycan/LPS O-acetylase OafA/YrhL